MTEKVCDNRAFDTGCAMKKLEKCKRWCFCRLYRSENSSMVSF